MRLSAVVLGILCLSGPAIAQQAAVLFTKADTAVVATNQEKITLNFGSEAPQYRIDSNDRNHVELRLRNTRNVAVEPSGAPTVGLTMRVARKAQFRANGGDLVLMLDADAALHLSVSTAQRRRLVITVDRAGGITTSEATEAVIRQDEAAQGTAMPPELPPAVEPAPGEDGYAMVQLKYADVSEVVGLLSNGVTIKSNDSFTPLEPGFGSPGNSGNNYVQPAQRDEDERPPLGQPVDAGLSVDRRLNAIWIKGSPEHITRVKAQIAAIDVPVDSVILETQFVELTENGARNIGIDFTNSGGQIAVATWQSGQFVPGLNYYNEADHVASSSFQAALNAQVQNGEGRIVSKPRIAAQSGASAKIITGDALPILTAITLSGVNGVSQQVQYVNVGVTLQIAPRVSGDGFVSSHVYCVVSSVTGYSQGYPTISQRHAETSATVRDGESFIIGGLSQEAVLQSHLNLPILGDVPLLGKVFRAEKSNRAKTDLYIIITPRVVKHGASAGG